MVGTIAAFIPAVVAIILSLITKQVYLSLFAGIFVGAMCLSYGNPLDALQNIFTILRDQLGENGAILIFLVVLGIFAVLMVKSGGSNAYSEWAYSKVKTKRGTLLMGVGLGACLAVDDYFDCMALGSVMRPVSDKHGISHSKLSYIIHSSAAPFCVIAPISSWSAAIATNLDGGIISFFKTIPMNLYAILAIAMVILTSSLGVDFFKMKRDEKIARETGDLDAGEKDIPVNNIQAVPNKNGKVLHLIVPVIILIICCIGAMLYNGWTNYKGMTHAEFVSEVNHENFQFFDLFALCDSSIALAVGAIVALFATMVIYIATKVVTFKDAMDSIVEGFTSMVPAMLILVFAWTLSRIMVGSGIDETGATIMDGTLNAKAFVINSISADSMAIGIIPFIFFIIAAAVAFATGTSWGTFGVLIPIASAVISPDYNGLYFLAMAAILGGAVYGDNTSPISDTTILASSAARSNHLNHVKTQLPYATIAAIAAGVSYLILGFIIQNEKITSSYGLSIALTLGVGIALFAIMFISIFFLDKFGIVDKIANKIKNRIKKNKSITETVNQQENTNSEE